MSNSTHQVEVVPIKLEKHPNADSLSIVNVFGGYTCCVRTADWAGLDRGAYLPPDSMVDTSRPDFSFLAADAKTDGRARIRARKLRGIVSFGLLMPAPAGSKLGDNVADALGVTHYEPPLPGERGAPGLVTGGEAATPPPVFTPKFDLEAFRKYHNRFVEGELVWVTEKIHGASARYVYIDGQMHCGSRGEWKKEYADYSHITADWLGERVKKRGAFGVLLDEPDEERIKELLEKYQNKPKVRNLWWDVLDATTSLAKWCQDHPGKVVYGEVLGAVQSLHYGHTQEKPFSFSAFDILDGLTWLDPEASLAYARDLPWVPRLASLIPYSFDAIVELSDGPSLWPGADHYREGCVVKPIIERACPHIGRVCLKSVGATYLERDGK